MDIAHIISHHLLIGSNGNVFADKVDYSGFNWPNKCGDFFRGELVKFIWTIMKRNVSPAKQQIKQINVNAHTHWPFMAIRIRKSPFISPNGNLSFIQCLIEDVFSRPWVSLNVFNFESIFLRNVGCAWYYSLKMLFQTELYQLIHQNFPIFKNFLR